MYVRWKGVIKLSLMHQTEQNTKTGHILQWYVEFDKCMVMSVFEF